jgi:hypothetical protein
MVWLLLREAEEIDYDFKERKEAHCFEQADGIADANPLGLPFPPLAHGLWSP